MNPELEETIVLDFITSSPTTGGVVDADSLPTCEVFEDSTDTAILSPTVTKRSGKTGNYRVPVACTAANGFEIGKSYNVAISATVGGVAAKAIVRTFQVRILADLLWVKPMTELTSVPAVTASMFDALRWLFTLARNKLLQTNSTQALRNDADSANIGSASVADDGTTFTRGKFS